MNSENKKLEELTVENYIWIIYIAIAIFNIYGDELIRKYLKYNDEVANKKALDLFKKILVINIIIYLYFLNRNFKQMKNNNYDSKYIIRFVGSILVFAGTLCFFYFQNSTTNETDSLSNI